MVKGSGNFHVGGNSYIFSPGSKTTGNRLAWFTERGVDMWGVNADPVFASGRIPQFTSAPSSFGPQGVNND